MTRERVEVCVNEIYVFAHEIYHQSKIQGEPVVL